MIASVSALTDPSRWRCNSANPVTLDKDMLDPRYPIGRFQATPNPTKEDLNGWLNDIEATPKHLRDAVAGLTAKQWETPYREGGWTVRQVVHHVPESHMQSYTRFKLALTEDEPLIKPYQEDKWAELADNRLTPPETSLVLLEALHERWNHLLHSLSDSDWQRTFRHPELGLMSLTKTANLYAWHGRHHTAQITELRKRFS